MKLWVALLAFASCGMTGPKHSHALMFFVGMWILWHTCRSTSTPVVVKGHTENVCPRCHTASTLT